MSSVATGRNLGRKNPQKNVSGQRNPRPNLRKRFAKEKAEKGPAFFEVCLSHKISR
jgi:hypothetical protein